MLYSSDAVKGIRSSRVNGRYQPKDALNILLGGTGLSFKFTDPNTVVVQKNKVGKSEIPGEKEEVKKPIVLKSVVVTATKSEMNVWEVPTSVNVVTSKEIELTPFADNMQEALRYVPGTYFSKFTAFGPPRLQVRGEFPAFLVNGREIAQLFGTYAGLHGGLMDMDAVERIEVIRGPQSAVHGSRAISGVINIITKKGDKENPYIKIHALAGTGDELRGGMSVSGGYEKFSYFITGSKMDQEDLETPKGDASDETESQNLYARLDYNLNDYHSVTLEYMYGETQSVEFFEYPHKYYTPSWRLVNDIDPVEIQTVFLSYNGEITDWFSLYAGVGLGQYDSGEKCGRTVEDYYDPERQDWQTRCEDHKWGEIRGNFDILDKRLLTATAGVQYKESDLNWHTVDPLGWGGPVDETIKEKETYVAPYLQVESKPIDYLLLSAGIRYDKYSYSKGSDKNKTSPKVGLSIFPFAHTDYDRTTLWTSYSEGFRVPTGSQMYGAWGGNPDLKPEESKGWEIGLKQRLGCWANIEASYFDSDYTDKINYDRVLQKFNNIGEATVKGYELLAETYPTEFLRLFVAYTDLDRKDTKNHTKIYGSPGKILATGFSIEDLYGLYLSVRGTQNSDWEAKTHGGGDEVYKHPSENDWLWDAKLSCQRDITNNILLEPFISVENLADKEYYHQSLLVEGRAWHVGISVKVNL